MPRLGEGGPDDAERTTLPLDLERHMQGLVRTVAEAGGDPIPPEMRATLGHRPLTGHDTGDAAPSPIVETETISVSDPVRSGRSARGRVGRGRVGRDCRDGRIRWLAG